MQSSMFNLRVTLDERGEVFLMNTLTDAQLVVSSDVAALLDRSTDAMVGKGEDELEALALLHENGFLVESRDADRRALDQYLSEVKSDATVYAVFAISDNSRGFAE